MQRATFLIIADTMRRADKGLVRPVFRGAAGHPVGFSATFRDALCGLSGDEGAKALLRDNRGQLLHVSVDDPGVVKDFDTKASFNAHFSGD